MFEPELLSLPCWILIIFRKYGVFLTSDNVHDESNNSVQAHKEIYFKSPDHESRG